jgi:tetratricopeptide (TPR) repeat protein
MIKIVQMTLMRLKEISLVQDIILKGNEHIYKKEYSEAIRRYDKAIEIDPNNASEWTNKGAALAKIGKHNGAIEYYDKALQVDPNNVLEWTNKGAALAKIGKHEEAIEYFDKAFFVNPTRLKKLFQVVFLGYPSLYLQLLQALHSLHYLQGHILYFLYFLRLCY